MLLQLTPNEIQTIIDALGYFLGSGQADPDQLAFRNEGFTRKVLESEGIEALIQRIHVLSTTDDES